MTKNIEFVITRFVFSSSKCTKIRFRPGLRPGPRWGSLRRSPRPLSRLGRGIPTPHTPPRSTPLASRTLRLRRLGWRLGFQAPLNTKSWPRQCHCLHRQRVSNSRSISYRILLKYYALRRRRKAVNNERYGGLWPTEAEIRQTVDYWALSASSAHSRTESANRLEAILVQSASDCLTA